MTRPRDLINELNMLSIGDLDALRARLETVKGRLSGMGEPGLSERISEALSSLEQGRTAEYRRLVSQVVSRLGHLD